MVYEIFTILVSAIDDLSDSGMISTLQNLSEDMDTSGENGNKITKFHTSYSNMFDVLGLKLKPMNLNKEFPTFNFIG